MRLSSPTGPQSPLSSPSPQRYGPPSPVFVDPLRAEYRAHRSYWPMFHPHLLYAILYLSKKKINVISPPHTTGGLSLSCSGCFAPPSSLHGLSSWDMPSAGQGDNCVIGSLTTREWCSSLFQEVGSRGGDALPPRPPIRKDVSRKQEIRIWISCRRETSSTAACARSSWPS